MTLLVPRYIRPSDSRAARAAALALVLITVAAAPPPATALPGDAEAIAKASDLDDDPLDFQAVTLVCTRCHVASQFLGGKRSSSRWEDTYGRMARYGATGSDEQLNRVVHYFQKNLTVVNVNTSPGDELGPTLQVSDEVVDAILTQRQKKPFAGVADLGKIPGVDPKKLKKLASNGRLLF